MINVAGADTRQLRPATLTGLRRAARRLLPVLCAVVLTAAFTTGTQAAETRACAEGDIGGVPKARRDVLARGFNITGWLDEEIPRVPDMRLLRDLQSQGFRHVRLPVEGESLMAAFSPERRRTRMLEDVRFAVSALVGLGYGVVVDMHPGRRFRDLHVRAPEAAFAELKSAWRALASTLRDTAPDLVFLELLNEPAAPQSVWGPQARRLIATIREIAPDHTLVYGTSELQQIGVLTASEPLAEPNIVYAVHFYDPMVFTHQGMDWYDESPYRAMRGVPYPVSADNPSVQRLLRDLERSGNRHAAGRLRDILTRPWDDTRIAGIFANLAAWAARHGRPVVVGEFGVLKRAAPPADRARWLGAVRTAAERHCIGWSHWELDRGFGLLDESGTRLDPAIADALLGR